MVSDLRFICVPIFILFYSLLNVLKAEWSEILKVQWMMFDPSCIESICNNNAFFLH